MLRRLSVALLVGLLLGAVVPVRAEDQVYTVKRKDTLSGIARRYDVSVAQIAERNSIARNLQLSVGQRLIIPGKPVKAEKAVAAGKPEKKVETTLSASAQKAITSAKVKPDRWKYIVIHHSGVDTGTLKSLDRYHREERHMEHGLAYHFLIGNGSGMGDGEIAVGQRWKDQLNGGHLASEAQNKIAIGICLIGNFDEHGPSEKQLKSLENLTRALMKRCDLSSGAVKMHQQINVVGTRCPGSKFPAKAFMRLLQKDAPPPTRR